MICSANNGAKTVGCFAGCFSWQRKMVFNVAPLEYDGSFVYNYGRETEGEGVRYNYSYCVVVTIRESRRAVIPFLWKSISMSASRAAARSNSMNLPTPKRGGKANPRAVTIVIAARTM